VWEVPIVQNGEALLPVQAPPPVVPPPSSQATAVFVLGLLSLVTCMTILGPIAWALGHAERKKVRAGLVADNGLLTAGYVMGIVSTVLLGLQVLAGLAWLLFWVVLIGAAAAHGV